MDSVSALGSNNYVDMLQKATRRNTLQYVADARQSGEPVDVDSVRLSNQELRDSARETGVELYSQQLKKSQFETYVNASNNNSSESTNSDDNTNSVSTFDASQVNSLLQTAQRRTVGVAMYENLQESRDNAGGFNPSRPGVDLYT